MIPATPRKCMPQKRRQHIFTENSTAHNIAPCCICGDPIHRHDDQWIVEHIRALGLLGRDVNTNCAPAHEVCRRQKDKTDMAMIAKAKRAARACTIRRSKPVKRRFQIPAGYKYDWKRRAYAPDPNI